MAMLRYRVFNLKNLLNLFWYSAIIFVLFVLGLTLCNTTVHCSVDLKIKTWKIVTLYVIHLFFYKYTCCFIKMWLRLTFRQLATVQKYFSNKIIKVISDRDEQKNRNGKFMQNKSIFNESGNKCSFPMAPI